MVSALMLHGHSPRLPQMLIAAGWTEAEVQLYLQARVPAESIGPRVATELRMPTPSPETSRGTSSRSFSAEAVDEVRLANLIRSSAGTRASPGVAWAGGLSGLNIQVFISRPRGGAAAYVYDAEVGELAELESDAHALLRCVDTSDVNRVPALVVLSMRLGVRRGYRNAYDLTLIEAGQVYQRLEDRAEQFGFGVCAMGGIAGAANVQDFNVSPVLGVVVGVPEETRK